MTTSPTDQPTNLMNYYSLRLTVPHVDYPIIQECINRYSKTYIACLHAADHEVQHEHFHIFFLDLTPASVEAMRKLLKVKFKRQGNGFIQGKFMDNHIYKGLQYVKHDASVSYKTRGSGWNDHLAAAPPWVEKPADSESKSRKRTLERDPLITYSNVLWRARRHRAEHSIPSTNLGVVLEHLCRTTNYQPSVDVLRRGLDPWHFKQFEYKCNDSVGKTPDWWTPRIEAHHEERYRP